MWGHGQEAVAGGRGGGAAPDVHLGGGIPDSGAGLGHAQQADYGEEAGGVGDSDAGGSEPEPARQRGGSGSKRSRAAEVHNLSEKVPPLPVSQTLKFSSCCVL